MTSRHRDGGLTTIDPRDESDGSSPVPSAPNGPRHQSPTGGRHGGRPGQQSFQQQFGPGTTMSGSTESPRTSLEATPPASPVVGSPVPTVAEGIRSGLSGHRSPEPAAPPRRWPWLLLAVAALLVGVALGRASAPTSTVSSAPASPPITVTASAPPSAVSPVPSTPAKVTLPSVAGRNGALVGDQLRELGLTKVEFASKDDEDTVVVNPANWTAVKIQPGAGTKVAPDATVVVTMTKKN